jgi:Ataxin-3
MTYIYHERQDSLLCGQHCLNNLLQEPFFSSIELASIAQELDEEEMKYIQDSEDRLRKFREGSGNVDETGNFSFQVLKVALQRYRGLELYSWSSEEGRNAVKDPTTENAFIINHKTHWYTLRKINNHWWNLDSMKALPELISPFYLSAYLAQLREEGSTVFLVIGHLPMNPPSPASLSSHADNSSWHHEQSLLYPSSSSSTANEKKQEKSPFSGIGNRLGAVDEPLYSAKDFEITADDDEDTILAKAMSASLVEAESKPKALTPAEMRAKRLAALTK